jgi:tetratricopeptide (TPR) repeat protein
MSDHSDATGDPLDRGLAAAFGPGPAHRGALETLADSIGSVPRVLLRDTDAGNEGPLVKPASTEVPDAPGRYELLGEIARGGMGAVLKGRDNDLGRELAVKVLLEQHHGNPALVRRFVEEAQIGGQLQHPGIVPVYELGTFPDRRPYFAMKLVKGRTLAALLSERKGARDDLPRFLGIFEQVAQTVAYAHARGVIHRDLKPSNVMVGSFGEVQVMDWGLAKVLAEGVVADEPGSASPPVEESVIWTVRSGSGEDESQAGSVLGTPAYMAPEQAAGDVARVDRRADVFGLGSILCEILTGQPAYTGFSGNEVFRKAARGHTAAARARLATCEVDTDLVNLACDCLAVEPAERPRDAGAVAGRVTAYLAGVEERLRSAELERAQAEARAVEERRRRRVTLALAAAVLALVLTATVALAISRTLIQREQARSEANFQLARAAVDEMLTRLGEVELAEVPQMEPVRRTMLGKALDFYQKFLAQRGQDRSIRQETGRANLRLGDIEEMLGQYGAAEAAYDRAIDLLGGLAAEQPAAAAVRRDLASARHKLGVMLKKSNRFTEAEKSLREAQRLRAAIVAADPDNTADQHDATATAYQLGTVLARLGRVKEVEAAYAAAIDAERQRAAAHPDRPGYARELGRYLNNRGILQRSNRADQKAAEASFREALDLQKPLAEKSPTVAGLQWERARTTNNLAATLINTQGAAQAIPVFREALGSLKRLADDYPSVPDYQNELAIVAFNLGEALTREAGHRHAETKDETAAAPLIALAAGQFDDAITIYRRLIQPERFPHRPGFTLRLAQAEIRRAILADKSGKLAEAEPLFREAVQFLNALAAQYPQVPEYRSELGAALRNLATNQFLAHRAAEASRLLDAAISHLRVALRSNPMDPFYRKSLLDTFAELNTVLAAQSDHAATARAAETLMQLLPDEPRAVYESARLLATSAALAASAKDIPEAERGAIVRARAELALKRLQQAVKDGLNLAPEALDAPAFGAIRAQSPESLEVLRKTLEARANPRAG